MPPRLLLDENMSPRIARILQVIEGEHGVDVSLVADTYGHGSKDIDWIPKYSQGGGRFVLTKDFMLSKRKHELAAIKDNSLYVFCLSKAICQKPMETQAAFVMLWWPVLKQRMIEIDRLNPRVGEFCSIPMKLRPKLSMLP